MAEAHGRVKTAEDSIKNLEKRVKKNRSDYDSILQRKENKIDTHKRAFEEVTKDKDSARTELKETKLLGKRNRLEGRIAQLESGEEVQGLFYTGQLEVVNVATGGIDPGTRGHSARLTARRT